MIENKCTQKSLLYWKGMTGKRCTAKLNSMTHEGKDMWDWIILDFNVLSTTEGHLRSGAHWANRNITKQVAPPPSSPKEVPIFFVMH